VKRAEERSGFGHRYKSLIQGITTAVGARGIAMIANFFAVPLTVRYLGAERYGVWVTLTSVLAYLAIFDMGIGSTAINGIAEALANNNLASAKQQINSVYFTLTAISILIATGVTLAWPVIPWSTILGDRSGRNAHEISIAAATAVAIVLINFPVSATPRIMGACQKITLSNYWNSIGSVVSLLAVIVMTRLKVGLPGLVVAVSGSTLIVGIGSALWLYRHLDWLSIDFSNLQWEASRKLLATGLPFFAVQIAGIILFQTDNIIIAQILGARQVTPYSITWKLFSYATLLQVIALPSLWPAYADGFARGDLPWVRKTYRYNLLIAIGSTAAFVLVLLFAAKKIIAVWANPEAVPTSGLIVGMGVWTIISSLLWCQSCILGAAGKVRGQAIYSAIGAIVNVITSVVLGHIYGLVGIIMGTLAAYLICIIIPQTLDVQKVLKGNLS
jgi:O-antigen/teichoic acid export membrane protein